MNEALSTLDSILQGAAIAPQLFPRNSRYFALPTLSRAAPDGRVVTYLGRRFVPRPDRMTLVGARTVAQGDRLDVLAAQLFGDPELFWRLCDVNGALRPDELIEAIGRRLMIALPAGARSL